LIVRWSAPATADLFRIIAYIAEQNSIAAQQVAEALLLAGDSLAIFLRRGRNGSAGTRELATVRPYVVVYEVVSDRVLILRIWHAAQDRP